MNKNHSLRCKAPLTALAIAALIFTVLGCANYFLWYDSRFENLFFEMPDFLGWIAFLLEIAPYVAFILLICLFPRHPKARWLLPVLLGLLTIPTLWQEIHRMLIGHMALGNFFLFDLPFVITLILAAIGALTGFGKRVCLIIATAIGASFSSLSIIMNVLHDAWRHLGFYMFTNLAFDLGILTILVGLLIFELTNKTPPVLASKAKTSPPENPPLTTEQVLVLLQEKRELGILTEQEYQLQRAEIINRL